MAGDPQRDPAGRSGGLRDRRSIDRVILALAGLSVLLFAVDPLVEKHPYFDAEHWVGFHGIVGAGSTLAAVLLALALGRIVKRREDR